MNCNEIAALSPLHHSGELDDSRAADFAAHLETCPACALEVQKQRALDARIREVILAEEVDTAAIELCVRQQIAADSAIPIPRLRQQLGWRWVIPVAAAAVLLLVAIFGYRTLVGSRIPRVYADAIQDHQDEVVDRQPRVWYFDLASIEALAARPGVPPSVVTILAPQGFHLQRGKLCRLDGHVYLHLVYADGAHEFSLFLRQRDFAPLPGSPRTNVNGKLLYSAHMGREHVAGFQTDHLRELVVTTQSDQTALEYAGFDAGIL